MISIIRILNEANMPPTPPNAPQQPTPQPNMLRPWIPFGLAAGMGAAPYIAPHLSGKNSTESSTSGGTAARPSVKAEDIMDNPTP